MRVNGGRSGTGAALLAGKAGSFGRHFSSLVPQAFLAVRHVVGLSLLLLGIGTLLCRVDGLAARGTGAPESSEWVRTVDGWEQTGTWHIAPAGRPSVHPLVVAAGQGLLSVFALVACHRDGVRAGRGC